MAKARYNIWGRGGGNVQKNIIFGGGDTTHKNIYLKGGHRTCFIDGGSNWDGEATQIQIGAARQNKRLQ